MVEDAPLRLGAAEFSRIVPPGTVLITLARGGTVDEAALHDALGAVVTAVMIRALAALARWPIVTPTPGRSTILPTNWMRSHPVDAPMRQSSAAVWTPPGWDTIS